MQAESKTKDLWYHLVCGFSSNVTSSSSPCATHTCLKSDEAELEKQRPPLANVVADGALAVIAGADTTASALTALVYFILSDTAAYHKLRNEVDTVYPAGSDATDVTLHDRLVWMDACM